MLRLLRAGVKIAKIAGQRHSWVEAIARAASEVLGPCSVYMFESIAEELATGGSNSLG